MKVWKKYTVINISMLVGFVAAIFILPSNTHFWPVAALFCIFLGWANYSLYRKLQRAQTPSKKGSDKAVMIIVLILLLLDLLFQRFIP
jgi:hypothetical protein